MIKSNRQKGKKSEKKILQGQKNTQFTKNRIK